VTDTGPAPGMPQRGARRVGGAGQQPWWDDPPPASSYDPPVPEPHSRRGAQPVPSAAPARPAVPYGAAPHPAGPHPAGPYPDVRHPDGPHPDAARPAGRYPAVPYPDRPYADGPYPVVRDPDGPHPDGPYPDAARPAGRYPAASYPDRPYADGPYPVVRDQDRPHPDAAQSRTAYQDSTEPGPAPAVEPRRAARRGSTSAPAPRQRGATGIAGGPGERATTLGLGRGSHERDLVRRVTVPVGGCRRVIVASIKGGVGKTTTVAVVGSLLAGLRRDRVVALDGSSDWGTLAARLSLVPRQSVRDLAARGRHAVSEQGVLAQLVSSPSGLLVVGSDPQPVVSRALTEEEYAQAMHLLGYVASVVLVDVGAGLQQPFLPAALHGCDQLVVATAATWDAAQSAATALDWLAARGWSDLVSGSIVVMNNLYPPRRRRRAFIDELRSDLERRCRAVRDVPFDVALQPGGRILLRKLAGSTRQAYLQVAADIMTGVAGR